MGTEYINLEGTSDYDYIIFDNRGDDIVKMIHPYYHYGQINQLPFDIDDFSAEQFWEGLHLIPDTLIYTHDGNIVEGQYFHNAD